MEYTLQHLLAEITFQKHNIHMLHWLTSGPGFRSNHVLLQEIYESLETDIDEVGEMCLKYNISPMKLSEILEFLAHDEHEHIEISGSEKYDRESTLDQAIVIMDEIDMFLNAVRETVDPCHTSDLDTIQSKYRQFKLLLNCSK